MSSPLLQETLDEYLLTLSSLTEKVERYDRRIEELSKGEHYAENVSKQGCLKGIAAHTAMALLSEIGDFGRFPTAPQFSAFLGLVPSEDSSSTFIHRGSITKTGNAHLRRLVELASHYNRVRTCQKSKALRARQQGNPPEVIQYADKAKDLWQKSIPMIQNLRSGCLPKFPNYRSCADRPIATNKVTCNLRLIKAESVSV